VFTFRHDFASWQQPGRSAPHHKRNAAKEFVQESWQQMSLKLRAGQFYGETAQILRADGFSFTEKTYAPQSQLPQHSHELAHFCFVLAGGYRERLGANWEERGPAALVYYPPDVSHAEQHQTDGRHFLVEIEAAKLRKIRECGAALDSLALLAGDDSQWLAARMYREFAARDSLSALALESLTTELLVNVSRQRYEERHAPKWLRQARDILRESFANPPCLGDLAALVGVHPTHLARVFRRFERCTVGDYVRRLRVEYARQRILTTKEPLVAIALDAGFADQTHLTRSFKRVTGLTPAEFRRLFS
jgi:AraC family transcriptional regulator